MLFIIYSDIKGISSKNINNYYWIYVPLYIKGLHLLPIFTDKGYGRNICEIASLLN